MPIELGDGVLRIVGDARPLEKNLRDFSQKAGRIMSIAGLAITGAFASYVSAAANFESAFAGVRKTLDATEEGYRNLSEQMLQMSEIVPVKAASLARIAELGGQLGITEANIASFTRTIADLQVSTNLVGEAGVLMMGQFAIVTQETDDKISNLASSLVDLGNDSRTNEKAILSMAMRIGAAGTNAGMTSAEILGLAAAFSSVGLQAELGGTAISRIINDLGRFVGTNNVEKLQLFADVAGVSIEKFVNLFENRPIEALEIFFKGIARITDEGGSAAQVIQDLGFSAVRLTDVIQRGGLAAELFSKFTDMSSRAFREIQH